MTRNSENFYCFTVKPTVNEFLAVRNDLRRGRLAAIVLFHMADYWAIENQQEAIPVATDLANRFQNFHYIRDIANASKHHILDRPGKPARTLTTSDQVEPTPGLFQAPFGEGYFSEAAEVVVTLDGGSQLSLYNIVQAVSQMWEELLAGMDPTPEIKEDARLK